MMYMGGLGILYFRGRKKQTNSNFGKYSIQTQGRRGGPQESNDF